ncbi:hypothetical protein N5E15_22055 [Pantoea stewartii]|uniref:hypothetical protein n=1 Tax=Pantoea stewartii TaxID=66269 RepID=UPI0021D49E6C|nr:hypothetical protein [Pantoea stewartii]MCU7369263.1 hypothetical protein [Pantoea stewartii]
MKAEKKYELHANSLPLLLPGAEMIVDSAGAILRVYGNEYTFSNESAELIKKTYPYLNGELRVEEISKEANAPAEDILVLLDYFCQEGVLIDVAIKGALSGSELVRLVKKESAFWRKHINNQPFWNRVHSGRCTKKEIQGWGIEFYHYVESANEYMANGVAYCRESIDIRQKLSAQYAEEADHGQIFLDGLEEDGLRPDLVINAMPLPSTRALINFLNETAMESTLVYASVFALMQSDGKDFNIETLNSYYDGLITDYPFAKGQFSAYLKHASIDARLGHQTSVFENLYDNDSVFSEKDVERVFYTLRQLTRHFILFYEYISQYYHSSKATLPRRSPQLHDFLNPESVV